ncbi:hypothetical protein NDU88_003654 [Pleurodeles waltl]|uniref:Uncharacterized protein n=1 Tax=Pleurodeles waltl TaxID=8319 RepID=A0AAV7TPR5_PLEWA|nr:hypothetical protein NDU88_003654 [Pleurodeles waltl]
MWRAGPCHRNCCEALRQSEARNTDGGPRRSGQRGDQRCAWRRGQQQSPMDQLTVEEHRRRACGVFQVMGE